MEKNKTTGHKTINQLCREYEVKYIWALSELFLYWLDCGQRRQVVSDFESLRKSERNLLFRFFMCDERFMQLEANVLDIVLPIDKCVSK